MVIRVKRTATQPPAAEASAGRLADRTFLCKQCRYEWTPRLEPPKLPKECPACKRRNWR